MNYHTPVFKWVKMYGLQGWNYPSVNFNGLMIYKQYLMDDRKTPAIYKVVYAIVRPKSKPKSHYPDLTNHSEITAETLKH